MTEPEIAATLGISLGTVKSTVSRAVARLRIDSELGNDSGALSAFIANAANRSRPRRRVPGPGRRGPSTGAWALRSGAAGLLPGT
jgi:hypothetical protein